MDKKECSKRGEKMLRLLKNKEVKNAGWLISGKIFQMIISFIVGAIMARFLGPSNYGLINYAAAYVTFFTAISNLGINAVLVKFFLDSPEKQGEIIGTSLVLRAVASILSNVIIVGIVMVVDKGESATIIVTAFSSLGLIFHIFETFNYWFQAQYKAKITAIASLVGYTITAIYKIVLLALKMNVYWFALATSIDYIVIAIILFVFYKSHKGPRFSFSFAQGKKILSKSYHYIMSGTMVAIYGQTDKLMLKHMLNESEVSYYSLASSICMVWVFVLTAIIDSMRPSIFKLYKTDKEGFNRKNRQLYAIVFYMSMFVSLMFIIFSKQAIHIIYGEEYLPAVMPLKIITWYVAFSYLGVARGAWVVSEDKQKYLKYMYIFAIIINVGLNYALIPLLGASGAAAASLVTEICTSILLPCAFKEMRPNVKLIIEGISLKDYRQKILSKIRGRKNS